MQYVNDDMDELFRRAAGQYPLDTSSGDWSKVQAALQQEQPAPGRKDRRHYLWLLLLLPLALICNRYQSAADRFPAGTHTPATAAAPVHNNADDKNDINNKIINNKNNINENNVHASSVVKAEPVKTAGRSANGGQDVSVLTASAATAIQGHASHAASSASGLHRDSRQEMSIVDPGIGNGSATGNGPSELSFTHFINGGRTGLHAVPGLLNPTASYLADPHETDVAMKTPKRSLHHVYIGIMGGIDATTIKWQRIDHAGYDYGILAGYQLNKKWSVETGVFMDRKFYYTEGAYFYTGKLYMPPNSWITDVTGNCRMIEVPVSARYLLHASPRSGWFVTAGVSSYFMKKEDYSYTYYYASTNTSAKHDKSYTNASTNLFSVAQVSGGYMHRIGRLGSLRIEPYVKAPLSGLGFGRLPMTSAGVRVGLVRTIF